MIARTDLTPGLVPRILRGFRQDKPWSPDVPGKMRGLARIDAGGIALVIPDSIDRLHIPYTRLLSPLINAWRITLPCQ